jgi:hypothetical protein
MFGYLTFQYAFVLPKKKITRNDAQVNEKTKQLYVLLALKKYHFATTNFDF